MFYSKAEWMMDNVPGYDRYYFLLEFAFCNAR